MKILNNSNVKIVLPSNPTLREQFAGEELAKYLKAILSINAIITTDEDCACGNAFLIGGPERNEITARYIIENDFRKIVPGPEGMLIKAIDDKVILAGSSWNPGECERGTIYAVYELLERFLGCSLSAFSHPDIDAGEYVPALDCIDLSGVNYVKTCADRDYRTAIIQYADAAGDPEKELNMPFFDWLLKNRYNRILTWTSIYEAFKNNGLLYEIERRGLRFTVGHHESSRLFLPAYGNEYFSEHYYETHPEYFKLDKEGKRYENMTPWGQWVYCSRNENAIKEVAKNIKAWLKLNPNVDILALWPNDGIHEQCSCENCSKYTKTENYCYFVNEIAKIVNAEYPNVKFDLLIYVDLWVAPKDIKLEPSIIIDEATWAEEGLRAVGKPDGSCLAGTDFETNLLKWRKTGAEVVYYDYYMGVYPQRQRWIPMADELQSLWKRFIEKDIMGSGTQIECFNMWNHLLNYYAFARTGYDTTISLDSAIKSLTKIYGNGAEMVGEIYHELEDIMDGQVDIIKCGHYLMAHVDKEKIYAKFEKAFSLCETKRARNNLRLTRMVFRYSDLETSDPASLTEKYASVFDHYKDETGELAKMTEFDSFYKNNPGYAITIPLSSKKTNFVPDKWYIFE